MPIAAPAPDLYMKRINFGIAIMLFGAVAAIGCLAQAEWILAICWGSGIIGLFNAICGYFSKDEPASVRRDTEADSKNGD